MEPISALVGVGALGALASLRLQRLQDKRLLLKQSLPTMLGDGDRADDIQVPVVAVRIHSASVPASAAAVGVQLRVKYGLPGECVRCDTEVSSVPAHRLGRRREPGVDVPMEATCLFVAHRSLGPRLRLRLLQGGRRLAGAEMRFESTSDMRLGESHVELLRGKDLVGDVRISVGVHLVRLAALRRCVAELPTARLQSGAVLLGAAPIAQGALVEEDDANASAVRGLPVSARNRWRRVLAPRARRVVAVPVASD